MRALSCKTRLNAHREQIHKELQKRNKFDLCNILQPPARGTGFAKVTLGDSLIFGMAQQDVLRICFDVVFYMGLAQWLRSWVLLPYLLGLVSCLHDCLHGLQIPPRSAFGVSCFGPARLLVAWPWHIRPWARHGRASLSRWQPHQVPWKKPGLSAQGVADVAAVT